MKESDIISRIQFFKKYKKGITHQKDMHLGLLWINSDSNKTYENWLFDDFCFSELHTNFEDKIKKVFGEREHEI